MIKKALFFVLTAFAGVGIYNALHPVEVSRTLSLSEKPSALTDLNPSPVPLGGPFQLIDHTNQPVTEKSFGKKYLIVYFGYSYCPDICPMALHTLSQVMEEIDPKGRTFQPLFITVDPKRDTVKNLALYVQNFHPTFVMLTGSSDKIKAACKAYRVYAAASQKEGSTEELIDHSSIVYVMSPEGQFVTHFNHQTPKEEMIEGLRRYLT